MAKTMRKKNLKIQILAGNPVNSWFSACSQISSTLVPGQVFHQFNFLLFPSIGWNPWWGSNCPSIPATVQWSNYIIPIQNRSRCWKCIPRVGIFIWNSLMEQRKDLMPFGKFRHTKPKQLWKLTSWQGLKLIIQVWILGVKIRKLKVDFKTWHRVG